MEMNLTIEELKILLNNFDFKVDVRKPPDEARRKAFKTGWNYYLNGENVYSVATINARLTWQNLGNRLSQKINKIDSQDIDEVFDILAMLYEVNANNKKENNLLDSNLESDEELSCYEGKTKSNLKIHKITERDIKFVLNYKKKNKNIKDCPGCGLKPMKAFGIKAINFFDLHHITPLVSRRSDVNTITSENDVVLLCPNCHRLIHKLMTINDKTSVTLDELRNFIFQRQRQGDFPNSDETKPGKLT